MPSKPQLALKRLTDIILSSLALVLLSPLFLGLAVFIKLRSPGPVFFRQTRVGLNGQNFSLLKFRSMHNNAAEFIDTATTLRADPRVFRGGETIRKYKLDELPQIVNVVLGDMSLVGPRPTVGEDYQRMTAEQRRRVSIRPGLSGLSQISGNTSLSWPERIMLDLEYIDNLSMWNDIKIMARTIGLIFSGRADTHPTTDDEWSCAVVAPKIICLGMNEESAKVIAALVSAGAEIRAIAGLPAENAENVSDFVDLAEVASTHAIAFLPVSDVNAPDTLEAFRAVGADMLFVLGWSQLLDSEAIEVFPLGVVGSHPSELPYGRGRAPVAWTVLEDQRKSAVTLFRMTSGVDDGTILKQVHFDIPERPTARLVYDLVADTLAHSFAELYGDIASGRVEEVAQNMDHVSWRSKRVPADSRIDFRCNSDEIDRLVRAASEPYPAAYSYFAGERVVFHHSLPASGNDLRRKGTPGQILARRQGMILVQTGDAPLWLSEPRLRTGHVVQSRLGDRFGFQVEDELYDLRKRLEKLELGATE